MARELIYADPDKGDFKYTPNASERLWGFLISPLFTPTNKLFVNINNPTLIAALTTSGLFMATVVFYPENVAIF